MSCPFLRETRVRSCQASPLRKLIVEGLAASADEKCSNGGHAGCAVYRDRPASDEDAGHCPYLHETLMQYCGVQSVPKLVPYSENQINRCGSSGHRFCEMYLSLARPAGGPRRETGQVEGIEVPLRLHYSSNHMWLDLDDSGACHIGIDALLARVLGTVDRVSFVTSGGLAHPDAVLTLGDADWPMVFPNAVVVTGTNVYLRGNPAPLVADPYGAGWLFEGRVQASSDPQAGLRSGREATDWMREEVGRLSQFVQDCSRQREPELAAACDGGIFVSGLLGHFDRDEIFRLFHEFFDSRAGS